MDVTALPSELLVAPTPLIGFYGLDVTRSIHKNVWDAFNINRKSDRAAVQFKLLPPNYEFPVAKPKRASYEYYNPKGILKRNWMLKHLHVLPSMVVLFQDLEWNDTQWAEKQVQAAATVQTLKNALQERSTRFCIVLLQKAAPLPPGEDLLASERAGSLTAACGINSKMLFILPHTEHLMGYTLRLESAFLDMAQSYYVVMAKRIRTHRDQLTSAHTTLRIRHQFKLGFVAEMRQDFTTALKHYAQSYTNLDEIRITDTNCLELKTIAGFLNYKICRLMFKIKVPRDAISHFISHIEKYKNRVGFKELIFEHYAWLSTQNSVFAELFCEAIKNGLPALQTQHPGIYFHKAAEFIARRKEAFLECCSNLPSPTIHMSNSIALYTDFFGIRAVKIGDPMAEQQINSLLIENEKSFNHSNAIINLLSQAMAQFKIYKCLRFRKKLAIDMAEEYFKNGDHAKALTLYSLMLPDYRQDNWSSIFSDVLLKTLRCALLSASVTDYISCSIEALSLKNPYDQAEHRILLENLWKVFHSTPPVTQCQNSPEVRDLWITTLATVKSPIHIDMDNFTELFEMCATFESAELKNDEIIKVHLIVKLHTDVPLKIRSFSILLTDGVNTFKLQTNRYTTFENLQQLREAYTSSQLQQTQTLAYENFECDLKLEPDLYYQFLFFTEAQQFLENTQLRVTRIEAQLGTDKIAALLTKSVTYTRHAFRHYNRGKDLNDNVKINAMCYIAPTFHLSTQTNLGNETMLVNEFYPVITTVNNQYDVFLQNVGLNISVPDHLRNKVFLTTDILPSRQKLHSHIQIDIGDLSMQSSNMVSFYIFSLIETTVTLQQKIWYVLDIIRPKAPAAVSDGSTTNSDNSPDVVRTIINENNVATISPVQIEYIDENRLRKTREDALRINCELEFKFTARFYTLNKKQLVKIYRGENFLLRANMEVQSKCDVDILETYFICDHNVVQSNYSFKRKKFTNTYRCGDKLEDVILLRINATLDDWITSKDYERNKNEAQSNIFKRTRKQHISHKSELQNGSGGGVLTASMNKSLMAKIPTNMTIISNTANNANALMVNSQSSNMSTSTTSTDEMKVAALMSGSTEAVELIENSKAKQLQSTRLIYNKAIDAIQQTGHCRGFMKGAFITEDQHQQQQQHQTVFGVYCIKWRRNGSKDENESKFLITGLDIENPPLNICCTIDEKIVVKMPITFKVELTNPTPKVLHLIATLSISNTDNFICSGHKQLDISIFAQGQQQLVYNLYPLCVGWQHLPELTLEYNTQADPSRDGAQNHLLSELVQRAIPKRVFVLPPLKQQSK